MHARDRLYRRRDFRNPFARANGHLQNTSPPGAMSAAEAYQNIQVLKEIRG